jgi:putative membrane protein
MSDTPVILPTAPPDNTRPDQVHLALERTYLAHERTLMAWVRTSTSLIAFGFTLYQFFFYLHEREGVPRPQQLFGPRTFGLVMIGVGVVILVIAAWQHRQSTNRLRVYYQDAPFSLSLLVAALVATLGVLGFAAALFRQ